MGNLNWCMSQQLLHDLHEKGQQKVISNAPSTKYALRMKNKFPTLPQHVEVVRSKNQIAQLNQMLKESPVYFIHEKSSLYQGHWRNGLPHGYGRILFNDFSFYQGLIVQGQPNTFITPNHHQQAIYIFLNGSYYIGEFKNARFQGRGKLIASGNQLKIVGSFRNGLPHGKVIQNFLSVNQLYEGQFQNGIKHGSGKYYVADKLVYQGNFQRGNMHGQGRMIDYNGSQFIGRFQNGKKLQGELRSINGNIRGDFNAKDSSGQGYYEWDDGKFYIGSFRDNCLHGNGKIYHLNGRVIQGLWEQGHNLLVTGVYLKSQKQIQQVKMAYKKANSVLQYRQGQTQVNLPSGQIDGYRNGNLIFENSSENNIGENDTRKILN